MRRKIESRSAATNAGHSITANPLLSALRRNVRAIDAATTARIPNASSAVTACSRLDPPPKFLPATTMSPLRAIEAKRGSRLRNTARAISSLETSSVYVSEAGQIASVLTPSRGMSTTPPRTVPSASAAAGGTA